MRPTMFVMLLVGDMLYWLLYMPWRIAAWVQQRWNDAHALLQEGKSQL